MSRFKTLYYTATHIGIRLHIGIERLTRQQVIDEYYDPENRDSWCTAGKKPCPMFDARPCCPPRIPVFEKLRQKDYLYCIHIRMFLSDFLESYPQYDKPNTQAFFMSNIARKVARKLLTETELQLRSKGDTIFKVGGCSSCYYKKGKPCKNCVMPALEGVGIKVTKMCEEIFDSPIQWLGKDKIEYFTALGGIYTSQKLSKQQFKEAIENVCKRYEQS